MKPKFYDNDYASYNVYGADVQEASGENERLTGTVATPYGYVRVIGLRRGVRAWGKKKGRTFVVGGEGPVTRLWFIWKRRHYGRTYPRVLTVLGATRAAGRFAREVAK